MKRFLSTVAGTLLGSSGCFLGGIVGAQAPAASSNGYLTDPQTGIVYRKVTRTIETPVTETKMETRTQTVYKPQTVTETKPMARTVYTPIIENRWEPRVHGRWNPFTAPTVAYHHVPRTHWSTHLETVQQTQVKTQWVPESQTVEVPTQLVRMQRQEKVDFEPVGRVAAPANTVENAIASRLRPLHSNERIDSSNSPVTSIASAPATFYSSPGYVPPRIAASTIGRMTSDPPRRTLSQGGLRASELVPNRNLSGTLLR